MSEELKALIIRAQEGDKNALEHLATNHGVVHICVDNGRTILEELLAERFGIPIKIDFMSLEA